VGKNTGENMKRNSVERYHAARTNGGRSAKKKKKRRMDLRKEGVVYPKGSRHQIAWRRRRSLLGKAVLRLMKKNRFLCRERQKEKVERDSSVSSKRAGKTRTTVKEKEC